eukprot:gene36900-biopygen34561
MLETQTAVTKAVGLDDRSDVSKVAMSAAERVTSLAARLAVAWVVTRVGPMDMMTAVELVAWTAAKMDDLSADVTVDELADHWVDDWVDGTAERMAAEMVDYSVAWRVVWKVVPMAERKAEHLGPPRAET